MTDKPPSEEKDSELRTTPIELAYVGKPAATVIRTMINSPRCPIQQTMSLGVAKSPPINDVGGS